MKKKVLFIVGTLQSGGVSKSMVNLLNAWDKEKYDTSLLLCAKKGDVFSKYLPENIKEIYSPVIENVMGGMSSAKWLLLHGYIRLSLGVLLRLIISRFSKSTAGVLISKMMPVISEEKYDLIVDYGGQQLLYYMVDKLKGEHKVSFFHSDYAKWPYYYRADRKYFPQVDAVFTISDKCVDSLKKYFPDCADKIYLMENINLSRLIYAQAEDMPKQLKENSERLKTDGYIILCTIGHIIYNKGIDLAIDAADILKGKGYKFRWIFIGKIAERKWVDVIKKRQLESEMLLLGIRSNPYPYLKIADIYVHPSRFEGKSIALDEAKIMCKPVVVTNFTTVLDQFEDQVNGSICKMEAEDLAAKIEEQINHPEIRRAYSGYLRNHLTENLKEVEKLYEFLEN